MYTIAIDLGGTNIKVGLLSTGHLIEHQEIKAIIASGLKTQLPLLESTINKLLQTNQIEVQDILGISFSFPGLVYSSKNIILSTNQKYNDGPDMNLTAWAKEKWNCPLFVENDARVALLGEWQLGTGKGYNDLVQVTLGTGFGTAVLINGQLLKGKHFQAGNLGGHFTVNHKGTVCTCGNIGCVESEASTWRLPSLLKEHSEFNKSTIKKEAILDFKALFHHSAKGDIVATEVLSYCLSAWSAGIITLIHAFDPEIIILSGGIMKSSSVILPFLQEKVNKLAWTPCGKVKLVEASFPDSAALYGGDYLVRTSLSKYL